MDKSGIFVGGAMGAMIVIVIFTILIISPPESIKPEIKTDGIDANANKEIESPYSKNFSLIEIFENHD